MQFYTVGYGGRTPAELVGLLESKRVAAVADVRLRPDHSSMGSFVKVKSAEKGIEKLLLHAGIEHYSFVELGNIFSAFENWTDLYRQLLERAGDVLTERLKGISVPFCLLCAEKNVVQCHRLLISNYLIQNGFCLIEHL
jgi:uncharacterized protein (DUF488 family)